MKVKKLSGFIGLALFGVVVNGQVRQPHSLYFMNTIPQVTQMNPALQPRANGYVVLAGINADYFNDIAMKDAFQKHGNKWYTPIEKQYDYNKLYKSIGKKAAMINSGTDVDFLHFGFRTGNGYFTFGLSEHITGNSALPTDLFKISENGFPEGTKLDFSPLHAQSMAYMQALIGYSGKVNNRLTIGVNVKPLFGQLALATKTDKFKLHTGEEKWDLDAKGNVYSSLPADEIVTDSEGRIYDIIERNFDDYKAKDWINDYAFTNPGIAFDFGAVYQINERLSVSASLNNLGFISWKNDLNSISFDGKYTFNGLYFDASSDDDFGDLFKNLGDSILNAMNYEIRHDKFKTPLTPVFHAAATYQLSKSVSAGFLSRTVFWEQGVRQSFNASFNLQPYSFVSFNAGATYQVKGGAYLGGGFTILLGPLQIYLLADYLPIYYSTFQADDGDKISYFPERLRTETIRFGVNLIFGKHGYTNKPMLDNGAR